MNFILKDINLFNNIQREVVANYLEEGGWKQQRLIENEGIIWGKNGVDFSNMTLVLLLNQEVADFLLSINLLVENLANFEGITELEILLKLMTNLPNVEIQGLIVGIRSPEGDILSGDVDFMGVVMNKLERIKMVLFDRDYVVGIRADQEPLPVLFGGDLVKGHNGFVLKNVCNFEVDK